MNSFGKLTCVLVLAVWKLFLVIQLPAVNVPHSEGIKQKSVDCFNGVIFFPPIIIE